MQRRHLLHLQINVELKAICSVLILCNYISIRIQVLVEIFRLIIIFQILFLKGKKGCKQKIYTKKEHLWNYAKCETELWNTLTSLLKPRMAHVQFVKYKQMCHTTIYHSCLPPGATQLFMLGQKSGVEVVIER